MIPTLITDHFYQLHQEDAAEALNFHFLEEDSCPSLSRHMLTLGVQTLRCAHCGLARDPVRTEYRGFNVPIEVDDDQHPLKFHDVQSAFTEFLAGEPVKYTDYPCAACQSTHYLKAFQATVTPQVLVLNLNRFKYTQLASGEITGPHAINHPVATSDTLTLNDDIYELRSVVVHLGASVHAGHYITIARHDTRNGKWWVYNDAQRREATAAQVATTCLWERTQEQMKSYVLFYERRAPA